MEIGQSSTCWHNEKLLYCFIKSSCSSLAYSYTWFTWFIFSTEYFYRMELKTILQWWQHWKSVQSHIQHMLQYFTLLSSLDLIVYVEGALWKTRDVIHLQPSCFSTNCPGLSLLCCSQSVTNVLWVAGHSCSFSFLLLFQRECVITSAMLLLTLGHQGNLHPTRISTSSDGFGEIQKAWNLWGPTQTIMERTKENFKILQPYLVMAKPGIKILVEKTTVIKFFYSSWCIYYL